MAADAQAAQQQAPTAAKAEEKPAETAPRDEAAKPVEVDAKPIDQEPAEERDPMASLELMVKQKGRKATGWALIKAGIRVLFGKSATK